VAPDPPRSSAVRVGVASPDDADALVALVASSGLPLDGLRAILDQHHDAAWVMRDRDGRVSACAVVEPFGRVGLLRSVAVAVDTRSRGRGATLIDDILRHPRIQALDGLYLLTETAERFFARRGFRPIARDQTPAAIRASSEFASVCPASARVMVWTAS
jgi:amino-acid N-acetyltransferase